MCVGNLAHSLTKDQLNVQAYKRAKDSKPTSILQSIRDEQTLVTSVSVVNNEMYVIEAHVQVIDKAGKVYKSFIFNDWDSQTNYKNSPNLFYAMLNSTNNCSKLIEELESDLILNSCTTPNQALPGFNLNWNLVTLPSATKVEPIMVESGDFITVQCYGHDITYNNKVKLCGSFPYNFLINTSFIMNSFHYHFTHEELALTEVDERFFVNEIVYNHPWSGMLKFAGEHIENAKVPNRNNGEINNSIQSVVQNSFTFVKHSAETGAAGIVEMFIVFLVLWFNCRRNLGKDPTANTRASVNINIGDKYRASQNTLRVSQDSLESRINPLNDKLEMPSTPFNRARFELSQSLDSISI